MKGNLKMKKEKYIIELRKRLSILDEKVVDDIVCEYLDLINQKINIGSTEEEVIDQLGNVNELAKKILKSYKISETYIKLFIGKEKLIDEINDFVLKLTDVSSSVYGKIEESVSDFARTTGHVAKNVYKETLKFGEEKINEMKKALRKDKKQNDDNEDNNKQI